MTRKEDNATPRSLRLPIGQGVIGEPGSHREAAAPVAVNREGSAGRETASGPGGREGTMKGKESKENHRTKRNIGNKKSPGRCTEEGT